MIVKAKSARYNARQLAIGRRSAVARRAFPHTSRSCDIFSNRLHDKASRSSRDCAHALRQVIQLVDRARSNGGLGPTLHCGATCKMRLPLSRKGFRAVSVIG
jgi:hypothetical protein